MTSKTKTTSAPKPKRGVGQVIARRRRNLAEQNNRRAEERIVAEKQRAREMIQERRLHRNTEDPMMVKRTQQARHALNVLSADHKAFMAAIGFADITLNTQLATGHTISEQRVKAYTDFSSIYVRVPVPPMQQSLKRFVIDVRGVLHHEAGHIRFTTPLPELWEHADKMQDLKGRTLPLIERVHTPWNCLEDQRMEAAVVRATPRIANYFTSMVKYVILDQTKEDVWLGGSEDAIMRSIGPWLAVAGRSYLPDSIRLKAKEEFDHAVRSFGITADQWFDIVARYMSATTKDELVIAILDAKDFLDKIKDNVAGTSDSGHRERIDYALSKITSDGREDHRKMSSSATPHTDESESASTPQQPGGAGSDGEDKDDSGAEESNSGAEADGGSNDGSGTSSGTSQEEVEMAAEQAVQALLDSAEIDDVMSRIAAVVQAGAVPVGSDVERYAMPAYMVDQARLLAASIEDALEVFRTEKSPVWARHQESGYMDALAYRTRQPGERTYHREPQNWDTNGLGVHVSFLADRSGSMSSNMAVLSQSMWATKTACDALDIPSTMVLWSDQSTTVRVMEDEEEPMIFVSQGGTDPTAALDDMDSHVDGTNLHHLVFLFTDGAWGGAAASLAPWSRPDRTTVIIGLNCEQSISTKDADVVIPINSINQLGAHVKSVLEDHVASH
jgi:hypothetical protein